MFNKYQQGGMMPPQQQGQGGLPPELQQILNSLPEDVKQYIMSLPLEQQIQELSKIAQGQMQAVQNSPNQMMQQQMNTPPQGMQTQPMKFGGKYQTGGSPRNYALEKPIGNVIPNYPYNTVEQPPKYNPGAGTSQFMKGQKIRLNGKDRDIVETTINGKTFLGYIGDDGAFRPLNIGKTISGNTAPQGGVNTGMYDFNPPPAAKVTPIPPRNNPPKAGPKLSPPVKAQPPVKTQPTPPKIVAPPSQPGYKPDIDQGGGTTSPHNPPVQLKPTPEQQESGRKVFPASPHGWNGVDDLNNPAYGKATINYGDAILRKAAEVEKLKKDYEDFYHSVGNAGTYNVAISSKYNSYVAAKNQLENLQKQQKAALAKRQYGGMLYQNAGNASEYIDPSDLPYRTYKRENRKSARDVRQFERQQNRLERLKRREQRLIAKGKDDNAMGRMNEARQARVQGRMNINDHQANVHAYNRNVAEQKIEQASNIAMPDPRPPQRMSFAPAPIQPRPTPTVVPPAAQVTNVPSNPSKPSAPSKPKPQPKPQPNPGKVVTAPTPTLPTSQPPQAAPAAPYKKSRLREFIGNVGGDLMKVAEKIDPGYWVERAAKAAGASDDTARVLGIAGSVGSMFIPGMGIAGFAGKAARLGNVANKAAKAAKVVKAAEAAGDVAKVAKTAKAAEKALMYGPRIGQTASSAIAKAGNIAKGAISAAPGASALGEAGVNYGKDTEQGDWDAKIDLAKAAALGFLGARNIRGLAKTAPAQRELGEYANVAGKGLHKRVLNPKTGDYTWQKVKPGNVGDDVLRSAEKSGLRNPKFATYDKPGTYADDVADFGRSAYDTTKKGLTRIGSSAKSAGKTVVDKTKELGAKAKDAITRKAPEVLDDAPTLISKGDATFRKHLTDMGYVFSPDGKVRRGGLVVEAKTLNKILDDFRAAMATKSQYGGSLYYKTGGRMKIKTCKYGCH